MSFNLVALLGDCVGFFLLHSFHEFLMFAFLFFFVVKGVFDEDCLITWDNIFNEFVSIFIVFNIFSTIISAQLGIKLHILFLIIICEVVMLLRQSNSLIRCYALIVRKLFFGGVCWHIASILPNASSCIKRHDSNTFFFRHFRLL